MNSRFAALFTFFSILNTWGFSQALPYTKIYSHCLDADVRAAAALIEPFRDDSLSQRDAQFIREFSSRFSWKADTSTFLATKDTALTALLSVYQEYWRTAVLDPATNYDSMLARNLSAFLTGELHLPEAIPQNDTDLNTRLKEYIRRKNLLTTGYAKTGKLYDLLVWRSQKDTTYSFEVHGEVIQSKVVFLDNFITLGWEEYATLNRYAPGGWSTTDALFCVREKYNLKSENFLVSYLCHEARHFADLNNFSKLSSADLEYRAKLTELSMLKTSLYNQLEFFINNAVAESQNAHSVANYYVIHHLSRSLFKTEFEKDISKWKALGPTSINETSYRLLARNTKVLKKAGPAVTSVIREK